MGGRGGGQLNKMHQGGGEGKGGGNYQDFLKYGAEGIFSSLSYNN